MTRQPLLRIQISEKARQSPLSLARAQAYEAAAPAAGWQLLLSGHDPTPEKSADAVVAIGAQAMEIHRLLVNGHGVLADGIWSREPAEVNMVAQAAIRYQQPIIHGDELLHAPVLSGALTEASEIGPITSCEARGLHPHHGGVISQPELLAYAPPVIMRALLSMQVLSSMPLKAQWKGPEISAQSGNGLRATWRAKVTSNQAQTPSRLSVVVATHTGNSVIQDLQISSATGVVRAELMPAPRLDINGEPIHITQSDPLTGPGSHAVPPQLEWFGMIPMLQLLRRATVQRTQPLTGPALFAEALRISALASGEADDPSQ